MFRIAAGAAASRYGRADARRPARQPRAARRARAGVGARRQAPRLLLPRSHLALGARRPERQAAPARDDRPRTRSRLVDRRQVDRLCRRRGSGLRPRRSPRASGGDATAPDDARRRRALAVVDAGWPGGVLAPRRRPLAAAGRRRRGRLAEAPLHATPPQTTSSRAASRRTASASPTSRIARATTAIAISGWRSSRPARAIASTRSQARARSRHRRVPGVVARRVIASRSSPFARARGGVWVVGVPDVLGSPAAAPAPQGDGGPCAAPARDRRPRCSCRATVARRPGRPTASAWRSPTCRRPTSPTTAIPSATPTSRRRSLPAATRSACGSSTRRCRSIPASARS